VLLSTVGARVVAAVVVGAVVWVAEFVEAMVDVAALADTRAVKPSSTSIAPGARDESACNMTAPERYFITSRA